MSFAPAIMPPPHARPRQPAPSAAPGAHGLAPSSPDTLERTKPQTEADVAQKARAIEALLRHPHLLEQARAAAIVCGTRGVELDALLRYEVGNVTIAARLLAAIDDPSARASLREHLKRHVAPSGYHAFDRLPGLGYSVARVPLTNATTPLAPLPALTQATGGGARLFVKRDDLTSALYGGNKARKLELTLADPRARDASRIVTGGGTGSHMTVAVAAFAQALGVPVTTVHFDQTESAHVRENLKLAKYFGADMHRSRNQVSWALSLGWQALKAHAAAFFTGKKAPYVMKPGDSNPRSSLGYVNAALELAAQVQSGAMPEPDFVFVATGSCGTAAGLAAGFRLAGLRTKVVCVKVASGLFCHERAVLSQANATLDLVREQSFAAPVPPIGRDDIIFTDAFYGKGYGEPTSAGARAIELAQTDGLILDETYTAKAMAAMLAFAERPQARGKNLLFWNTLSSRDLSAEAATIDPSDLPPEFADCFTP